MVSKAMGWAREHRDGFLKVFFSLNGQQVLMKAFVYCVESTKKWIARNFSSSEVFPSHNSFLDCNNFKESLNSYSNIKPCSACLL